MKKKAVSVLKVLAAALAALGLMVLPDALFMAIKPNFRLCWNPDRLSALMALSLILVMVRDVRVSLWVVAVFCLFQVVQFCNMAYFGCYISPYAIAFIFLEARDVFSEAGHIWTQYVPVLGTVLVPFALLAWGLWKTRFVRVTFRFAWVGLVLYFSCVAYLANTPRGAFRIMFKNTCYSGLNTINAFTMYFTNVLPRSFFDSEVKEFEPYEVKALTVPDKRTLIFVIGESINPDHLSLLGYARPTTPLLEEYARQNPDFIYQKAWSAAANTLLSLPRIFNIQANPLNYTKLIRHDTDLLRMAQANGFYVTYVELQNAEVFRKTSITSYDELYVYDKEKDSERYAGELEYLEYILPRIARKDKNLIIIHKRNAHSPYDTNYSAQADKFGRFKGGDYSVDTYDNSILYEDFLLDKLLTFAGSFENETYFYYTSDHGEALGEKGLWSHGHLDEADLQVPFFFKQFNGKDEAYADKIKAMYHPCAFDISKLIAEKLGYDVTVTGEDPNVCLINSRDSMGKSGIFKVTKDPISKTETYQVKY